MKTLIFVTNSMEGAPLRWLHRNPCKPGRAASVSRGTARVDHSDFTISLKRIGLSEIPAGFKWRLAPKVKLPPLHYFVYLKATLKATLKTIPPEPG